MTGLRLRDPVSTDAFACAQIRDDWIDETDWLPRTQAREQIEQRYREVVFAQRTVQIAELDGMTAGLIAVDASEREVTSLFVAAPLRSKGIGTALLDWAKCCWPKGLQLWTFVANVRAQQFYLREGFREVRRAKDQNDEHLPDILYHWGDI